MHRFTFPIVLLALCVASCSTIEGPRIPLQSQDISAPVPTGVVRVVFFNTSNRALFWESGWIRIRLDGRTVPTLWLDEYTQILTEPGEHRLLLEHFDLFQFTDTYTVTFSGTEVFLEVFCTTLSTKFRQVERLPAQFPQHFNVARDPAEWNAEIKP